MVGKFACHPGTQYNVTFPTTDPRRGSEILVIVMHMIVKPPVPHTPNGFHYSSHGYAHGRYALHPAHPVWV